MITALEQKKLRTLFGGHYTEDVLKILNKKIPVSKTYRHEVSTLIKF